MLTFCTGGIGGWDIRADCDAVDDERGAGVEDENQFVVMIRTRMRRGLEALEESLKGNNWLAGQVLTVANIIVAILLTTLRYFEPVRLIEQGNRIFREG